ncbi:MAG TPA: tetratricopeptide repeat protein [Polyangiaceae bacterium]|jgi:tetratricopeptide (TPR) repeat protein|nr:tetratricopeptide repeat protein [Polyangiaceae bacterium]
MNRRGSTAGWLVGLLAVLCLNGVGCRKAKPKPPPPPAPSASHVACDSGETLDPPHREARPAIQALRSKDYASAQRLFEALLAQYPESSSLRVWQGDALLGQDSADSAAAALAAYAEARALDARGCKLRERERYFLAIGVADAQLRQKRAELALSELAEAAREWPDSAEVVYDRARAECLLGKSDDCFADLQRALTQNHARQHVRFSRSHHSSEDLWARAEKQPEFAELRKEPRCRALLASTARSDAGAEEP